MTNPEAQKPPTLHLMHCSTWAGGTDAEKLADIKYALSQDPDIVSFTEMADQRDLLREACKGTKYVPVFIPNNKGECFAVRVTDHSKIKDRGAVQVHPGQDSGPAALRYGPRYVSWATVKWHGLDVTMHTAHWLAHLTDGDKAEQAQRQKRHTQMTNAMATQVRKHGAGDKLSFFSGDCNADDDDRNAAAKSTSRAFRSEGLLTVWDEKNVHPPTHADRTIDIIGRLVLDKKIKALRYKVHPKQNSDHRFISVFYEITPAKKGSVGGSGSTGGNSGGAGSGSGGGGHRDPYVTGGNIDWSDYEDGTVYDLPYAVDDSDGSNH